MTASRAGVRVFDSERIQPDRQATLLEAYDLFPPPKPTLNTVIRLAKNDEISADKSRAIIKVESINVFWSELEEWIEKTGWRPMRPGSFSTSIPAGYVYISQFLRDHVSLADGKRLGIYANSPKNTTGKLSSFTRDLLDGGDVPSFIKITGHGYLAARQSDVEEWLWRRWNIEIKR